MKVRNIPKKIAFHLWVKLTFNHSRQMLLFWKEKMVNEGLRRFFLVNGKRIRQLQQHFACLKKATFRLLIWDLNLREKKKFQNFVSGCFFLLKENKMRKFQKTFVCFKKASNQLTILNPFFTQRGTESNNAWTERGKDSVMLGSEQAAKHFHETYFFFPLYSFFTKRSSHFKLVVQHVKMKPAKRLS